MKKNKTLIIICLAGLLAISGFIYTGHGIQAAESGNSAILIKETVEYVKNDDLKENEQIAQVFGESAPTLDGYLFGGWYQDTKGDPFQNTPHSFGPACRKKRQRIHFPP